MSEKTGKSILVSACLLGLHCRYNGTGVLDEAVWALREYADLIPVCPEILGGLATPREPAEQRGGRVMTESGKDVTARYERGAAEALHLARLYDCRAAILKERSPSCGYDTIYDGTYSHTVISGDGVTGKAFREAGIRVFGETKVRDCLDFLKNKVEE